MNGDESINYEEIKLKTREKYEKAGSPNHLTALLFSQIAEMLKNLKDVTSPNIQILKKPPKIVDYFNGEKKYVYSEALKIVINILKEYKMDFTISSVYNEFGNEKQFPENTDISCLVDENVEPSSILQLLLDKKERFISEGSEDSSFNSSLQTLESPNSTKTLTTSTKILNPLLCSGIVFQEEESEKEEFFTSYSDLEEEN